MEGRIMKQLFEREEEIRLRIKALELVNKFLVIGVIRVTSKDNIIETAEKFYKFLKGEDDSEKEISTDTTTIKDTQISYTYNMRDITKEDLKKIILNTVYEDCHEGGKLGEIIKGK